MRSAVNPQGYTIVEVMIFLAVSGGLFVLTSFLVSGQQARTEFTQGVRETESQIQDIINDVSSGYYTNTNNFNCTASVPGRPSITAAAANQQGANSGCIFIGRAIQFAVHNTDEGDINIYTVVGRRQVTVGTLDREVKNYDETVPTAIARSILPGTGSIPDAFEQRTLQHGLQVKWVRYIQGGTFDIGTVGLFSTFGQYAPSGANLVSGSQTVNLVPVPGSALNQTSLDAAAAIDNITTANTSAITNPSGGVEICFESGTSEQYAILTIGGGNRQRSTKLVIETGAC